MGGDGERGGSRTLLGPSSWHPDPATEQRSGRWMRVSPGGGINVSGGWPLGQGRSGGVRRDAEGTGASVPWQKRQVGPHGEKGGGPTGALAHEAPWVLDGVTGPGFTP